MATKYDYRLLRMLEEFNCPEEFIAGQKRKIRHPGRRPGKNPWITVHADCDGRLVKRFYPGEMTIHDWHLIQEAEIIKYQPTYYDCSGQAFTSWIDRYRTSTGYWVYHKISYDD